MMSSDNLYRSPAIDTHVRARRRVGLRTWAFMVLTIAAVANLFRLAQIPDEYRIYFRGETPPFPYPWDDVFRLSVFMLLHATVLYYILRPESYDHSWKRSLAAFGLQAFVFYLLLPLSMHMPPHFLWPLIWIFLCACASLVLGLVSGWTRACQMPASISKSVRVATEEASTAAEVNSPPNPVFAEYCSGCRKSVNVDEDNGRCPHCGWPTE